MLPFNLPVRKSKNLIPSKPHKHHRFREYILYCCPTGAFCKSLEAFLQKAKEISDNGANNYNIPHITLVSFFKASEDARSLISAVKNLASDGKHMNQPLQLELYRSENFIGYFVKDDDENVLKRLALNFVKEVSDSIVSDSIDLDNLIACFPYCASVNEKTKSSRCIPKSSRSISLEPHVKNLHLTLAYQFPTASYNELSKLVETLDTKLAHSWELRLYSRDTILSSKQVHKVIYPHTSREPDELELHVGDFIYINTDAVQTSVDGWIEAISFSTGKCGFIPLSYTEKTSETTVWELEVSVPISQVIPHDDIDTIDGINTNTQVHCEENRLSRSLIMDEKVGGQRKRVIVLRHGERIDFAFGHSWTQFSFNESGNYIRMDLNMPETLPPRSVDEWVQDSPLTTLGNFQSQLVGSSLKSFGVNFTNVFVSPAYRCLQTANGVISAMGVENELPLNIEYGLFEWLGWYEGGLPNWLSEKELGVIFNVNESYKPIVGRNQLVDKNESLEEFYERNSRTMREILKHCTGDVLIVAHATNLETCTRQLTGKDPRTRADLRNLLMKIPFLSAVAMEQTNDSELYQLIEPPVLTLTHNSCSKFDWRILDDN